MTDLTGFEWLYGWFLRLWGLDGIVLTRGTALATVAKAHAS